jgi:catechol 2,3-dioxygenase-like lactoylglutathione lyase family enzyme
MTPLTLDHLVIAVRDLPAAEASYRRLLGLAPSWHGRHPSYGTENVLFRLRDCYVELLAPAADAPSSPWRDTLVERLDGAGEGLYAIALGTSDIDATVAAARAAGLDVLDPLPGDGVDLATGARRAWRNARIRPESTRGVPAFFIQHDSPPGALPLAQPDRPPGSEAAFVDHTVVASSHLDATLALWRDAAGLDLRATVDWPPGGPPQRRLHFLRVGESILELAGEAVPARPGDRDALWGVSYRVDDLAATVARLRDAGVSVSDVRTGNAPGTVVADVKPGFSHDVRTLFIQKEPRP